MDTRRQIKRPEAERAANIVRVLEGIARSGPAARHELSDLTGLSRSAVADVVSELVGRGLVTSERLPTKRSGRPREILRIKPDALLLGGASADRGKLHLIVTDAAGSPHYSDAISFAPSRERGIADHLSAALEGLFDRVPQQWRKPDVLGLVFPGLVDTNRGLLLWAGVELNPPLPLAVILSERLGIPVFIENPVTAHARAERLYGDGRDVEDFVVITQALGLGQYIGGRLRIGRRGRNPEFRHFKVGSASTRPCDCGAMGCLHVVAAPVGLARAGSELMGRPLPGPWSFEPDLARLLDEASAGNEQLRQMFAAAGAALGIAVSNVVNLHDPDRVIVSCVSQALMDVIREPFEAALRANSFPPGHAPDLRLKVDVWTNCAMGAVALGLERLILRG